ncbi:MAG: hypothetical protein ACK4OM_05295 [Alphaproteobacteria bacterium]
MFLTPDQKTLLSTLTITYYNLNEIENNYISLSTLSDQQISQLYDIAGFLKNSNNEVLELPDNIQNIHYKSLLNAFQILESIGNIKKPYSYLLEIKEIAENFSEVLDFAEVEKYISFYIKKHKIQGKNENLFDLYNKLGILAYKKREFLFAENYFYLARSYTNIEERFAEASLCLFNNVNSVNIIKLYHLSGNKNGSNGINYLQMSENLKIAKIYFNDFINTTASHSLITQDISKVILQNFENFIKKLENRLPCNKDLLLNDIRDYTILRNRSWLLVKFIHDELKNLNQDKVLQFSSKEILEKIDNTQTKYKEILSTIVEMGKTDTTQTKYKEILSTIVEMYKMESAPKDIWRKRIGNEFKTIQHSSNVKYDSEKHKKNLELFKHGKEDKNGTKHFNESERAEFHWKTYVEPFENKSEPYCITPKTGNLIFYKS